MTDQNRNCRFAQLAPALRSIGQVQKSLTLDYHGLLMKFQRRFADNFGADYTWNKAIDSELGQRRRSRHAHQRVHPRPAVQPGPGHDVTHTLSSAGVPTVGRGPAGATADERHPLPGLPFTVTQTQGVQSTGTEPPEPQHCRDGLDDPTIERWFDTLVFRGG